MKKRRNWLKLIFIIIFTGIALVIDWPGGVHFKFEPLKIDWKVDPDIKEGLDLQGGSRIVYQADLSKVEGDAKTDAMNSLRNVIESRINSFGVTEPLIQTSQLGGESRLTVEMPGISDVQEAMDLIGKTAQLEFKEIGNEEEGEPISTGLTGNLLKRAAQEYDQNGSPVVSLEFNSEGAKKFEEITERNIGKPVAIYLDDQIVSAPNVNEKISGGKAQISGGFSLKEAKNLAIQLNAGALPVPIKVIEQRTIGASLGQEAIEKSIFAGVVGLVLVALFMIFYYRLPGLLSVIALTLYTLFVLAIFKIFPGGGITLNLAGVAAFVLSIGMAVDANVLIFERMKEELRAGKNLMIAVEAGFNRAWTSIRDSNVSSIITALILFIFGSGTIRGFAVVLIIGVLVSMLTAINVTRTFLRITVRFGFLSKAWMYLGHPRGEGK